MSITGRRVVLRPLPPTRFMEFAQRVVADPEARPWWSEETPAVVGWLEEPDAYPYIIVADGEEAGIIVATEETDPFYRHAGIDVTLFSPFIGKGLGSDALRALCRHLFNVRGHHRITIDPAAMNTRAVAAYERVGFKRVGILRQYERGPDGTWRDGLLMDMLPEDLKD